MSLDVVCAVFLRLGYRNLKPGPVIKKLCNQNSYNNSMVDNTKVLCQLFDENEIFIPGDSPGIFQSLDKM